MNAVRQWVPESGSRYMKRARAKLEVGTWNLKKFGCGRVWPSLLTGNNREKINSNYSFFVDITDTLVRSIPGRCIVRQRPWASCSHQCASVHQAV